MAGINIDKLNSLVKKNNYFLDQYLINQKNLISKINNLNSCYEGITLEYLFSKIQKEIPNIQKISGIIENYSDVLLGAKLAYQRQSSNITSHMNKYKQ